VKDSEFEVDIRSVQTQSFVHPHSCRHQQAEKGRIGAGVMGDNQNSRPERMLDAGRGGRSRLGEGSC
jgi:hypothetical protein